MLSVLATPHDNVLAVRIDGKIDEDDMERMTDRMEALFEGLKAAGKPEKLRVYVEVVEWRGITFGALMDELAEVLPHINDFERKAVVSDIDWMETVTNLFAPLTNWWIEGRHYRPENRDEAMAWVAE
jgi:hypothetical protein